MTIIAIKNRQSKGKGPDSSIIHCFVSILICKRSGYQHNTLSKWGILPSFRMKISSKTAWNESFVRERDVGNGLIVWRSPLAKYLAIDLKSGIWSVG
jgi:hypothetical protein